MKCSSLRFFKSSWYILCVKKIFVWVCYNVREKVCICVNMYVDVKFFIVVNIIIPIRINQYKQKSDVWKEMTYGKKWRMERNLKYKKFSFRIKRKKERKRKSKKNGVDRLGVERAEIDIKSSSSSSSSSSYRAGSTDIPDPLSPLLPIVHRPRQVFRTTSRILT